MTDLSSDLVSLLGAAVRDGSVDHVRMAADLLDEMADFVASDLAAAMHATADRWRLDGDCLITFSGALIRLMGPSPCWIWCDGSIATTVYDLTLSRAHDFRCTRYGDGVSYVQVRRAAAKDKRNPELRWILDGEASGKYRTESGTPRGHNTILVPCDDWDARPPCGASWEMADQPAILARARELGSISPALATL